MQVHQILQGLERTGPEAEAERAGLLDALTEQHDPLADAGAPHSAGKVPGVFPGTFRLVEHPAADGLVSVGAPGSPKMRMSPSRYTFPAPEQHTTNRKARRAAAKVSK